MKLSREGDGGASGGDDPDEREADQSLTDVGDEPFISAPVLEIARGAVLAGRYQIETTIGKGGSGVVLRAFDRIAQSAVAVKILKPELAADPRWVERFSRELRLARQIQHANVCRVYDIGEADGHRFLTMELASEGTLHTGTRPDGPARPLAKRIADARALVSGMAAIHAAGIVHRDVKPENLLRMDDGRLVVSDFGLATNPTQTAAVTLMVGTPSYMAPEMAMGDAASLRSDVWAIGVVMHEILFSRRPEWEVTPRRRVFLSPIDRGSSATLRALATLCADCAAENPAARPLDAVDVARRFARAEAADARRHVGRFSVSRRWAWPAVAAVIALALWTLKKKWAPRAGLSRSASKQRIVEIAGTSVDIGAARRVATFEGRVHCVAPLPGRRSLRVVAGEPRQAFEVDVDSGARVPSLLKPQTYAVGCPMLSSDGEELLYETLDHNGGREILHSHWPDGEEAQVLTKGQFPEWIPGTQDFVFDLDLTHAAVFSIPVMNSSLVSEDLTGRRRLVEKAVSWRGDHVAIGYLDDRGEALIVVHALPTLEIQGTVSLGGSIRNLHFDGSGDQLEGAVEGHQGNSSLVLINWRAGTARYRSSLVDWDLRDAVTDDRGASFLLARRLFNDVWESATPGAKPRQLTTDGRNDNVAISSSGALLLQKQRRSGGYVVAAFDAGNPRPRFTTPGPSDWMPSFSDVDHAWFFVRNDRQAIVRCDAADACREVYVDAQMPAWPIASPDGHQVAYLTWLNTPRLKILSLQNGQSRDLGAALIDCAPIWSDDDHLWVLQASERSREWIEIDARTGHRAGRREPVAVGLAESHGCLPDGGALPVHFPQARIVGRETSEIRAIAASAPQSDQQRAPGGRQ